MIGMRGVNAMAKINQLQKELTKAVHAYNEKIRYHEQKGRDVLPQREYSRDLKKKLSSAQDYQREINRLRRFGKANVTKTTTIGRYDNIEVTQYEKREIQRQVANINRQRARRLEKVQSMEVTAAGKPTGYKRAQMPSFREADLVPKKLNWGRFGSKKELEQYKQSLEHQRMSGYFEKRAQGFKENYIKTLKTQYGEKAAPLISKIQAMKPTTVEDLYYSEQTASIEYAYMPSRDENTKLENLYNIWGVELPELDADIEL